MCGIAGFLNFDARPPSAAVLKGMTEIIKHRGPDGEGTWTDGPIALGHRRLAIIDLSTDANQPMHSRDGRFVLSFNGEIYNLKELRTELEACGLVFCTHSDTEVLLYALTQWGPAALERVNGCLLSRSGTGRNARCCLRATGSASSRSIKPRVAIASCSVRKSRRSRSTRRSSSLSIATGSRNI